MKALVTKNNPLVQQVVEDDQTFEVHEDLFWVDAPAGVTTEWSFRDGKLVEPVKSEVPYNLHRQFNYPPLVEQLDILFHEGYDGWKAVIQAVKDKYPKE